MGIVATVRRLRHGPLRRWAPLWTALGRFFRFCVAALPGLKVRQRIGSYGPFLLDAHFAFSDFEHWGRGHNNGFAATIKSCRGKQCVFDIGGHIGLVSLPISQVLAPAGKVYCFEPGAANLGYLRRHIALNNINNIEVVAALVGAEDGAATFFERQGPTGQNSMVIKKDHQLYHRTNRQKITVDSFCAQRALTPEVIKIDVEGAELMVLRGARHTLHRCRPLIFLSVHPRELELLGSSTVELAALIEELGYCCREVNGASVDSFKLAEYLVMPKEMEPQHVV